jgi:hypothetical protein
MVNHCSWDYTMFLYSLLLLPQFHIIASFSTHILRTHLVDVHLYRSILKFINNCFTFSVTLTLPMEGVFGVLHRHDTGTCD